jgi:hypothetical protein
MVPFRYLHIVYLRTLERYLQETLIRARNRLITSFQRYVTLYNETLTLGYSF